MPLPVQQPNRPIQPLNFTKSDHSLTAEHSVNHPNVQTRSLLIVGCGYVGARVAKLARAAGQTVFALTRSPSRSLELQALGAEPVVGNWLAPHSLANLPRVDAVLISIPHRDDQPEAQSHSGHDAQQVHATGLRNLLAALPTGWQKLVYLSTTGVYGQDWAATVNEETPLSPTRLGPQIAVAGEQWLCNHLSPERFTVLRLAGIYGPGRIPLAEKLRQGEPLSVPRDGHLNLVHVDDIAKMICVVSQRAMQRPIYVFSDGHPVLRETFYRRLAELCGVEDPVFVEPDPAEAKTRRATDKRIDPSRLTTETQFEFLFPNYESGLAAAIGATMH